MKMRYDKKSHVTPVSVSFHAVVIYAKYLVFKSLRWEKRKFLIINKISQKSDTENIYIRGSRSVQSSLTHLDLFCFVCQIMKFLQFFWRAWHGVASFITLWYFKLLVCCVVCSTSFSIYFSLSFKIMCCNKKSSEKKIKILNSRLFKFNFRELS
jgi:hypothetical protein